MPHVLFVCTANICRSPVAEGLLRQMFAARGMTEWTTSSAGTWAADGQNAAHNSQAVAADRGVDIARHRSRIVTRDLVRKADLVLCMESGHAEALRAEFYRDAKKIFLLSNLVDQRYSISDPYGQALDQYERMAEEVEGLLQQGFDRLILLASGQTP